MMADEQLPEAMIKFGFKLVRYPMAQSGDRTMYASIVRGQVAPERVDEVIDLWQTVVLP